MAKKTISDADAEKILQKDIANIVRKSAAGKVLTARERSLISQFSKTPEVEPEKEWGSFEHLGKVFGFHRVSFSRFVKDYPDAPKGRANGSHSVSAWREFFRAHPTIRGKSESGDETLVGKSALEIERLRQQCRKLAFENDLVEGKYLAAADVDMWLVQRIQSVKQILESKFRNELPPKLTGLSASEIAEQLDRMIGEICEALRWPGVLQRVSRREILS